MAPARLAAQIALVSVLAGAAHAQMHKVEKADTVTRAVGIYEYIGDPMKPKAARFTPISLFINGHFEDADVYLARPIPFALDTGLRYELMEAGVRKQFLDLVAARNFTNSAVAANLPFDNGWAGYGRPVALPIPKAAKLRPNCGNAHVVQEADNSKSDGKPHFGSKPADAPPPPRPDKNDPCYQDPEADRPEKITLDERKDANSPDPERPTLHRSPETTANNTGANGKPDKKKPKEPTATITANGGPADDPDRPTIRHREAAEDDPNQLPPDPIDLASRTAAAKALAKASEDNAAPATSTGNRNDTVDADATITAGNTMGGGPTLRRGKLTAPKDDPTATPVAAARPTPGKPGAPAATSTAIAPPAIPAPLDSFVAVSDAKDRPAHDFSYKFASNTEKATALEALEKMAQAVLDNPALASDASMPPAHAPAEPKPVKTPTANGKKAVTNRARTPISPTTNVGPQLADEQMNAYQLYYSAPITYTFTARTPATATSLERYVTVVATTDAEGKIIPAFRSTTDSAHLDRTPRYRLVDVVDADATNRAELLMELRAQHSRQFALYRLLGNKPDQVFLSGSTLL